MIGVQQKRVAKRKWRNGGHKGNGKEVGVRDEDDRSFVRDGLFSRDGSKCTPLVEVKQHVGIGDQSMSLTVGSGADKEPSKHGMATVPLFGLNGGTPSPFCQRGKLSLPFLLGVLINFGVYDIQRASQ